MRLIAISAVVILGAITLASSGSIVANATSKSNSQPKAHIVTVKSGDSLNKIAKAKKSTATRIYYANAKVKNPDLIYPGEKLRIPTKTEKLKARTISGTSISVQPTDHVRVTTPPQKTVSSSTVKKSTTPAPAVATGSVWDRLATCESDGNWSINTGNGFYGGLQFTQSSWQAMGGNGYPNQASRSEQIARAQKLQAVQGWDAWPACSAKLGLL